MDIHGQRSALHLFQHHSGRHYVRHRDLAANSSRLTPYTHKHSRMSEEIIKQVDHNQQV